MESRSDPGLEIRRILLLTRLKTAVKGMTMTQLVKDSEKVSGWNIPGKTGWDVVQQVLQTLIDDRLVALGTKFAMTSKGQEYLGDPLKWHIDETTQEDLSEKMFWTEISEVFGKAYHRLRSKNPEQANTNQAVSSSSRSGGLN